VATPTLTLIVSDVAALRALFEEHLSKRRAFVPGACSVETFGACELVIEHGARSHRLAAQVVYVRAEEPGRGAGLSLTSLEGDALEALRAFVDAEDGADAADAGVAAVAEDAADVKSSVPPPRMHERIRSLSLAEQHRMAMNGSLSERVALERMYGPSVWETLLKNPRITVPEVARIARKGTLPRPLVEAIGANNAWVAVVDVQRALLSNPRTSTAVILRVLQMMPRRDLILAQSQTAYPAAVRNVARRMLGG
jgi:hypothetical protein